MAKEIGLIETLALIKAGYTKKEIKAMADTVEELPENTSKGEAEPEAEKTKVEEPEASDPEPDYKTMFEELQTKYDDVNAKLKAAQEANITKDISGNAPEKASAQSVVDKIFSEVIY